MTEEDAKMATADEEIVDNDGEDEEVDDGSAPAAATAKKKKKKSEFFFLIVYLSSTQMLHYHLSVDWQHHQTFSHMILFLFYCYREEEEVSIIIL